MGVEFPQWTLPDFVSMVSGVEFHFLYRCELLAWQFLVGMGESLVPPLVDLSCIVEIDRMFDSSL